MELYNCESEREIELKETELTTLDDYELVKLTNEIHKEFREGVLEDETIVTDALYQIAHEALERLCIQKTLETKFISIGIDKNG